MLRKILLLVFTAVAVSFISCEFDDSGERLLVKASGRPGEILVIMDSVQWQGKLGEAIRATLNQDLIGVSRPEKLFTVRYIEPTLFNSVLNKARNLVFVATLDSETRGGQTVRNFLTKNYIQDNPDKFIISQKDIYASGQDALYLFSAKADDLAEKINNNKATMVNFFNKKEKERLLHNLFVAKEQKSVSDFMRRDYDCSVRVPNGYQIAANEPGFVWLRSVGETDKNVFVSFREYTSEDVFKNSNLIGLRDSITRVHVFEDPENDNSYTKVDTANIDTEFITTKFNGNYAKRIRGIWKANNLTIGGSFVSYVFVDEETNRLYYLDGFVIRPGKNKREALRELDVILSTFTTKQPAAEENS
jgi:hypothetical protein